MQCGFMAENGTNDAVFMLIMLQEEYRKSQVVYFFAGR